MAEIEAKLLYPLAHDEEVFPEKVLNELQELGIRLDFSENLTQENLEKYTGVVLNNPKFMSEEEVKDIIRYKDEKEGGIFIDIEFLNEAQAERFYKSPLHTLIKNIFNCEIVATRVLPSWKLGEMELEYEKKSFFSGKKVIKERKMIEYFGHEIDRRIAYSNHLKLSWIPKWFKSHYVENISIPDEESRIDENDVDFITSFSKEAARRTIILRYIIEEKIDKYWRHEIFKGYKYFFGELERQAETFWITDSSREALSDFFLRSTENYEHAGIVSPLEKPGRAIGICVLKKLFSVINDERFHVMEFLSGGLKWISEPRKYKLRAIIDRESERVKTLEKTLPEIPITVKEQYEKGVATLKQKVQESREELTILPVTDIRWKFLYGAAHLGYLLERGTIREAFSEMKNLGEGIERTGNPENYGSSILHFYRKFEEEQVRDHVPDNLRMEEFLRTKPNLISLKEDLHTLLGRIINHYERMEE